MADGDITLAGVPWYLRAFGLVFAGTGAVFMAMMLFGIGAVTVTVGDGPGRPATPADAWMPGIFLAIGLGLALVRYRVALAADRRATVTAKGWGFWVRRTETPLPAADRITVGPPEGRGSGSGRYTAIPVRAVGPQGAAILSEPSSPGAAHRLAQRIGSALGLPIDAGSGRTVLPTADELQAPAGTRVAAIELVRGLEIRIPMAGAPVLLMAAGGVLALLATSWFWWSQWRPILDQQAARSAVFQLIRVAPLFLGLLPLACGMLAAYRNGGLGGTIRVDPQDGLRAFGRHVGPERLLALEIRDRARWSGGLTVVTDRAEFLIARGQRPEDLRWIRALILHRLRGSPA